jgi:uncharacterized protein YbbC (DUF1343 family)/CubicO group peptidase (beta-lactamase class C family)
LFLRTTAASLHVQRLFGKRGQSSACAVCSAEAANLPFAIQGLFAEHHRMLCLRTLLAIQLGFGRLRPTAAVNRFICAGFLFCQLSWCDAQVSFRADKLKQIDAAISHAIDDHNCPGGVLWIEHRSAVYHKAYGHRSLQPVVEDMTEDTIFDLASLTKVVACTPAVLLLVERGQVDLDATVSTYLPEFRGAGKERITVRQLMLHLSGLRGDIETQSDWHGQKTAIEKAAAETLITAPGTVFRYSDINFFLLGEIVQRVTKTPLEQFVAQEIFAPLHMVDTSYLPPAGKLPRVAPTEVVGGKPFRGVVHDPTARHMGGVAGHAGLFSTAADLARYCRMLLNRGELGGVRIFKPETVDLMTKVQTPDGISARRGLGWDIDSGYSGPRGAVFPLGSYGHTGWTGTSLWIDPFSGTFVIFLANRNHPDESGSVAALRRELGTLAAEAVPDFNFAYVPGALAALKSPAAAGLAKSERPTESGSTLQGIDVLVKQKFAPLRGLRVGLITNHTGHDRQRNPTIDLLRSAPNVQLAALFSPEHGIRGLEDAHVADSRDAATGLPIYSLYGDTLKPNSEQLKDLDALVFDIQDVGCRFYTYTATMAMAMEAAAQSAKLFFVLDRVDPINGVSIEGPMLEGDPTFVAYHRVPLRYGMTIGELAKMYRTERNCNVRLTVIPLENWRRDLWFDQTGLPWTNPSPNMRNLVEATLYPGVGLLESAVSVGRGTDTPFEVVGAPYVNDVELARELNAAGLKGVRFVPVQFTPTYSTHQRQLCRGVFIILTDRGSCSVVDVGLEISKAFCRLYPRQFPLEKIERLLANPATLEAIRAGRPLKEIRASWEPALKQFEQVRAKYLMY